MGGESYVEEVCRILGATPTSSGLAAFGVDVVVEDAVAEPTSVEEVRTLLGDCQRCKLCSSRKNIVFGVGDPNRPKLMVVGEAPGALEDERGEPFVGPAGEMLDRMLERVLGLSRQKIYILNTLKCRPPKNRDPEPDEISSCRPFAEMQRDVVKPGLVLLLGNIALKSCLGVEGGITKNRGKWLDWGGTPAMATFHPAYLLRKPEDKSKTMEDLLLLKSRLSTL